MNEKKIEEGVLLILEGMNIDPSDRNYINTPHRYAKLLKEIFSPKETSFPTFDDNYDGLIVARKYTMYTFCPHHLLPVKLIIDMAYWPGAEVYGLSKLGRIASNLNTRPLLQEAFTRELAEKLNAIPGCRGSAVVVRGEHGCMQIRGIRTGGDVITCSFKGILEEPLHQSNFLKLIGG